MEHTISPLDNRYSKQIKEVSEIFSHNNFTKIKMFVECEYLKYILSILYPNYIENTDIIKNDIDNFYKFFYSNLPNECKIISEIENKTNHDVQALIVYMKERISKNYIEYIHFGLTSQDINSPAMVLTHKIFNKKVFHPCVDELLNTLKNMSKNNTLMLTFTHGQPATPTTFGRQMSIFANKISVINKELRENYEYKTKMGGSNGTLSSLKTIFPEHNWDKLIRKFVETRLCLNRNEYTVQIDDYTNYYKLFQIYQRICVVLINLCQDFWFYCSKKYIKLKNIEGEVGSSAMPHKINPIHFENAEGNLKLCIDIFESIGRNICINRLQRDLTDSTMLRNVGVACGHMILAIKNIIKGLSRVELNEEVIGNDLDNNSIVLMELIQLKLRSKGFIDAYNLCKIFSRGKEKFDAIQFMAYLKENNVELTDELIKELDINIEVFY